jgi:hypothetical protein
MDRKQVVDVVSALIAAWENPPMPVEDQSVILARAKALVDELTAEIAEIDSIPDV